MASNYSRLLADNPLVEDFLVKVLSLKKDDDLDKKVEQIVLAEIKLSSMQKGETLNDEKFRNRSYRSDDDRENLRNRIVTELITLKRLENDENIDLGHGGALPINIEPKKNRSAYIIIGLPASGKSTIANIIADKVGGVIVDSDYAKRKFPEFKSYGASLVHTESAAITFGDNRVPNNNITLYNSCISFNYNMVIPKIGDNSEKILELSNKLKTNGYQVHLVLVSLDRKISTKRALTRFLETGRYVPLSLIFDCYANEPILTYYRIKNNPIFSSYGKVSTNVEQGENPYFIESSDNSPVLIFKKGD